jgi:predicted nucleic acid-binding protein
MILIGHLRGNHPAGRWVERALNKNISVGVSVISDIELWIGAKNETQIDQIKLLLHIFRRLDVNRQIAQRTAELWKPFLCINGGKDVWLRDILIAATADYYRMDIVTSNKKHFERINPQKIQIITIE